jgi:hypothetical protein
MFRHACAFVFVLCVAPCAFAQDSASLTSPATLPTILIQTLASSDIGQIVSGALLPLAPAQPAFLVRRTEPRRPVVLIPLYGVGAVLQGLDYASTTNALARHAGREGNVAMAGIAGNHPAFLALKAAAAGGVVLAAEKMWKKNPAAAIVMVVAIDSAMAGVVAHNYSVR